MEISSYTLLNYLLEVSLCLAVFYLFYVLVLRKQPTFGYNRAYLLVSSLLALVLPLLEVPFLGAAPQEFARMAPDFSVLMLPDVFIVDGDESVQTLSWQQMVAWAYAGGVALMLMQFVWQIFSIKQVIRQSQLTVSQKGYWVVHTDGRLPVSSFFNYLLWDNHTVLEVSDKQRIIAHEEVHMAQGHSYDVCYMSVFKILLWFNPLAYLYGKELTDVHEYAADAKVIDHTDTKAYAKILVNQLFHKVEFSLLNHFYKSQTLKRLKMMELTKSKINRYRILWALPVFALMFFVFSCQEEDTLAQAETSLESYENIQEEINRTSLELLAITKKYPDFRMNFKSTAGQLPGLNSADDYISMIEGVDNTRDKKTIGELGYKMHTLQEKLPKQAMSDANEIFTVVEDQPTPEGGMAVFYDYVKQNLKYPAQARRMGIAGRVFIQFVVDKDGSITDVKAVKGIGAGCDEEAVRVLQNAAAWNPGYQRGRAVKVRMVLPITFMLDNDDDNSGASTTDEVIIDPDAGRNVKSTVRSNTITGRVVDGNNQVLSGVNILIKGTTTGTVSDINGNYQISIENHENPVLVFSSIGHEKVEIPTGGNSVISVALN